MADIGIDNVDQLRQFSDYLLHLKNDFRAVARYARSQGCNKSGFTGVFEVLKPAMDLIADAFDEAIELAEDRLDSTAQGLRKTAKEYRRTEHGARNRLDHIRLGDD